MPTRPEFGEGRVEWGSNRHMHPFRSAGVVGTARTHGGSGNEGDPSLARVAASTSRQAMATAGVGQGRMSVEAG